MTWLTTKVFGYALAGALVLHALHWGWMSLQLADARLDTASAEAELAAHKTAIANAWAKAQADARAAEKKKREAMDAVAEQYEKDKTDAQRAEEDVVADLRAGTERLRVEWARCETRGLSRTAASAAEPNAADELRIALAGAAVRVGIDADNHARGLQAALKACTEP